MGVCCFPPTHPCLLDLLSSVSCACALLGLAVYRSFYKAEYIRSVHLYDKEDMSYVFQQEFVLESGALLQISGPRLLTRIHFEGVKEYLEMVRKMHETESWKCVLQLCAGYPKNSDSLVPLRICEFQVFPSLAEDLDLVRVYVERMSSTSGAGILVTKYCNEGNPWLYEYVRDPKGIQQLRQTNLSKPEIKSETPQKSQLDIWQKWGSDLRLAGPCLSLDMSPPRSNALQVDSGASFQTSSSESSVTWDSLQAGESTSAVSSATGEPPFTDLSARKTESELNALHSDAFEPHAIAGNSRIYSQKSMQMCVGGSLAGFPLEQPSRKGKAHRGCHSRAATIRLMQMTREDLRPYFNMTIRQASKALKVGLTVFKKHCRAFGIPRWPHRKIKSLDGMIDSFPHFNNEVPASSLTVEELQEQREQMAEQPGMDLSDTVKRSRQAIFKWSYKKKRRYRLANAKVVHNVVMAPSVVEDAVASATCAENLLRSTTFYTNIKNMGIASGMTCALPLVWST